MAQITPKAQYICGSPQCRAMSTNYFVFYIILQYLIFILSYALSHKANLHRGKDIYAPSTRSSFPKLGQGTEPTPLSRIEPYIHIFLHKAHKTNCT